MRMLSRRTVTLWTLVLDVVLALTPILLSVFANIDTTNYIPGLVVVILLVHMWAVRQALLADMDERLRLAKLRDSIREEDSELFAFVDALTSDLVEKLERLREGELVLRGNEEYWRFVTNALRNARCPVESVDVNIDRDMLAHWGSTGTYRVYYDCSLDVVRNGHSFTRVFVFKRANAADEGGRLLPDLVPELKRQQIDGITVLVAWFEDLNEAVPPVSVSRDYLIFVGNKVIHAPTPQGSPSYDEAIVTKNDSVLKHYAALHQEIVRRAHPLDEVL